MHGRCAWWWWWVQVERWGLRCHRWVSKELPTWLWSEWWFSIHLCFFGGKRNLQKIAEQVEYTLEMYNSSESDLTLISKVAKMTATVKISWNAQDAYLGASIELTHWSLNMIVAGYVFFSHFSMVNLQTSTSPAVGNEELKSQSRRFDLLDYLIDLNCCFCFFGMYTFVCAKHGGCDWSGKKDWCGSSCQKPTP